MGVFWLIAHCLFYMAGNFGLLHICSEGFELLGSDIRCVCELYSELLRDTNLVWVFFG